VEVGWGEGTIESESVPTCVGGICSRPVPGLLSHSSFFYFPFFLFLLLSFPFFDFPFTQACGRTNRAGGATARVTRARSGEKGAVCVVGLRRAWGQKGRRAARWKGGALGCEETGTRR
jgi:hypothetical protein